MACTTLPADVQGCLNIELRRGDGKPIQLDFWDDAEHTIPKDMSIFTEIRMSIRQGGMTFPAVVDKSIGNGLDLTGNRLTIHFGNSDPVFQRAYSVLSYDIAFIGDRISHGIGGHIIVKKSETDTWTL